MGRPSKYEGNVKPKLKLIEAWCRDGLLMEDIALKLGIHLATLYEYKNRYEELNEALKRGREVADIEVENALFKTALGYTVEEETKELTENGIVTTKIVKKEVQPSNTAQIFWLKNRRPELWRDKREIESNNINTNNTKVELSKLSVEEIRSLLNK